MHTQKISPTQAICNHIRMYHGTAVPCPLPWYRAEAQKPSAVTIVKAAA